MIQIQTHSTIHYDLVAFVARNRAIPLRISFHRLFDVHTSYVKFCCDCDACFQLLHPRPAEVSGKTVSDAGTEGPDAHRRSLGNVTIHSGNVTMLR